MPEGAPFCIACTRLALTAALGTKADLASVFASGAAAAEITGAALATKAAPIDAPPPALFSTITGWPSRSPSSLAKARPSTELLYSDAPEDRAEMGWRLGLPLAAFNFVLLALAVTSANPRAGKSTSLAIALLAFVLYYNLMTLGQSWVGAGKVSVGTFLVVLHGGVLLLGVAALLVRHYRWTPAQLLRRNQGAAA